MSKPYPIPVQTQAEIMEDRTKTIVRAELSALVDEGLLNMGVDADTGESVFWPTDLGCQVLGMEADQPVQT